MCLEGTRLDILQEVRSWSEDLDAPNILWINGYPGVGKSAIASTIVEQLRSSNRLGSSFFFQRERASAMTSNALWRTVAHDLSQRYSSIRRCLITALNANESLLTTPNVYGLFRELIYEPLMKSDEIPIEKLPVIVLDALDECGGIDGRRSDHRKKLMRTLKSWSSLPRRFKLIVTSRQESDIEQLFSTVFHHPIEILAGENVNSFSSSDIRTFLVHELRQLVARDPSLPLGWPGERPVSWLVDHARGLFIWIKTVIKLLENGEPGQILKQVYRNGASSMADLYAWILHESFPEPSENGIQNFRAILGVIIFTKEPLDVASLANFLSIDESTLEQICNSLKAVLDCEITIRIRHQSFVDFLLDPENCPSLFLINNERESRNLILCCLSTMRRHLRFNICHLDSSYVRNRDVPYLARRVKECVPPYLSYASRYWASHLGEAASDGGVNDSLQYFMDRQFLWWLETMSLIEQIDMGSSMLQSLVSWLRKANQDESLARDMQKFVTTFESIISQSAPHIYISALPFAPRRSGVSNRYLEYYPQTLVVRHGGYNSWPAVQNVCIGHKDAVLSVDFSPDGRRIVSGSRDCTIRVWDVETGKVVLGPLQSHNDAILCVSFSSDGRRIVSGAWDCTIRVWDAERGETILGPLKGHTDAILSVKFSPDGRRIVSGSEDRTIRIWDTETGETVLDPLKGHKNSVYSVSFSPDGRKIASGSGDHTIRVWDAETGETVLAPLKFHSVSFSPDERRIFSGFEKRTIRPWDVKTTSNVLGPFEGHSNSVFSVSFSPDGRWLASGSDDRTIQLWDAETGEAVLGPLQGHDRSVRSISFSPDGRRIASGSRDFTIRIWDVETGEMVAGPLQSHNNAVLSVAFSADGRKVVSGSEDRTVRIWDAETSSTIRSLFEGHGDSVVSVSFSPDGSRFVSSSSDHTIRIWDAETGEAILDPLQGHSSRVQSVSFSPDGTRIVSGSWDHTIRIWDAETGGTVLGPLRGHSNSVCSVSFSPDGRRLVSGSDDHTVLIWDAETGDIVLNPLRGHTHPVFSVSFSPDGRKIISGSLDHTIRIWDAETGETVLNLLSGKGYPVLSVSFSPDGRRIAFGSDGHTVQVWDTETDKAALRPLQGHSDWIQSVSFSPDGTRIVSGSSDHTIRVWDAETGETILAPLKGHNGMVSSVSFSPDGRRIVSGSGDHTIRLWDSSPNESLTNPYAIFRETAETKDGWVLGPSAQLLFWVPPEIRPRLCPLSNSLVIDRQIGWTTLDLDHFVHGREWARCKDRRVT
ncbi:hypothetical protein M408DRAFT_243234 [Serendipita vermifera MAFF 305830]|uniref:Nephrocystin 3-like N-terminal domain-containing protein n=1 Tax=Serendipita vermifera MAFF 305830 TaxID=933852 RepID=A0A0C2WCS6_SERVB|nr:hypothetical protein M408DRAFT_243234 [Serendipita vermifera MAFF 305830]